MTEPGSVAEQITDLLDQLHHGVTTRESVPTYRKVTRGNKPALITEFKPHTTTEPGLLTQLGTIASTGPRTVQVEIVRTVRRPDNRLTREVVRTEAREVSGYVSAGAAIPGGSPGWDADGALTPLVGGKSPDAPEPVTEAWHVADQARADLRELGRELHEQGWRPPRTLVSIALEDEETGRRILGRLRSIVQRARIAAEYDAPIVTLRDVVCPICGSELRVRKDASSAVWCSGRLMLEGPPREGQEQPIGTIRCTAKWDRGGWVKLLPAEPAEPLVTPRLDLRVTESKPRRLERTEPASPPAILAGLIAKE